MIETRKRKLFKKCLAFKSTNLVLVENKERKRSFVASKHV